MLAEQGAVGGDDADVGAGDEQKNLGRGVLDLDAQSLQLQLQGDLAAAGAAAEDGGVVAQKEGEQAVRT